MLTVRPARRSRFECIGLDERVCLAIRSTLAVEKHIVVVRDGGCLVAEGDVGGRGRCRNVGTLALTPCFTSCAAPGILNP